MQSEERKNGHNHHDQSDQIDDPVHGSLHTVGPKSDKQTGVRDDSSVLLNRFADGRDELVLSCPPEDGSGIATV